MSMCRIRGFESYILPLSLRTLEQWQAGLLPHAYV